MAIVVAQSNDILIGNGLYTWANMALGDTGSSIGVVASGDRTVQIQGTFGAGGQVQIEGSLDGGANWYALRDPTGSKLIFSSADLRAVLENVDLIRPRVLAGDGTTSITVILSVRKMRNG